MSSKAKVPWSISSLIFFSPQKWAFWLNGVCLTASNQDDAYMRSQGLRLVRVSEKGVWCVPLQNDSAKMPLTETLPEGAFLLKPSLRRTKKVNDFSKVAFKSSYTKGGRKAPRKKKALSLGF
ncbi:MAG: hypothetical protein V6Z78_04525 [Holosporaceae bacterium]